MTDLELFKYIVNETPAAKIDDLALTFINDYDLYQLRSSSTKALSQAIKLTKKINAQFTDYQYSELETLQALGQAMEYWSMD